MAELYSVSALAEILGMDRRTVTKRLDDLAPDQEEVSGRGIDRRWDLGRVVQHLATAGSGEALNLESERARLAKEQADKTALDNATRRGELVEMAVVAEEWSRYFQAFRERFIGFPVKVAAELAALTGGDADTIRGRLDGEVEECLAAFHRAGGSAADDSPDARRARGRSPAAAAAVNGQRVGRPKAPTEPRKQRRTGAVAD